jgi:hypothetical protein
MLMISRAKVGARLTRDRKFLRNWDERDIGFGNRGGAAWRRIDQSHFAENVVGLERRKQTVAELNLDLSTLDDIKLLRGFAFLENRFARLEVSYRNVGLSEKTEADDIIRHGPGPCPTRPPRIAPARKEAASKAASDLEFHFFFELRLALDAIISRQSGD